MGNVHEFGEFGEFGGPPEKEDLCQFVEEIVIMEPDQVIPISAVLEAYGQPRIGSASGAVQAVLDILPWRPPY